MLLLYYFYDACSKKENGTNRLLKKINNLQTCFSFSSKLSVLLTFVFCESYILFHIIRNFFTDIADTHFLPSYLIFVLQVIHLANCY